jgi:type I restriction enzyme S subunit
VIKIGNVTSQGLDLSDLTYVLSSRQQEFEKYNISNGDVLMSLTGNIGRVVEVQNLPCPVLQNYRVGKFVTQSDDLLHAFMKTVLSSGSLFSQLDTLSNQSAQANFGKQDLGRLMMPLPNSINEQKKISELLELASRSISAKDGALVKLRALKTALMQDLLTGRKRVAALLDGKETSA